MIVYENLDQSSLPSKPCVLTIGNFDGVHLGHQRILNRMRTLAGPKGTVCVLTFSNHPSSVLPGKTPVPLIQSNSLKLQYLEKFGADVVYSLEFTSQLSHLHYDTFLSKIKKSCPFDYLILGEGDAFGYKREGTPEKVALLGKQLHFEVEYLPKVKSEDETISSGRIRTCIQQGHLSEAIEFLGHPYIVEAIDSKPISPHLVLPPDGDYPVNIESKSVQKQSTVHIEEKKFRLDFSMNGEKIFIIFT